MERKQAKVAAHPCDGTHSHTAIPYPLSHEHLPGRMRLRYSNVKTHAAYAVELSSENLDAKGEDGDRAQSPVVMDPIAEVRHEQLCPAFMRLASHVWSV